MFRTVGCYVHMCNHPTEENVEEMFDHSPWISQIQAVHCDPSVWIQRILQFLLVLYIINILQKPVDDPSPVG